MPDREVFGDWETKSHNRPDRLERCDVGPADNPFVYSDGMHPNGYWNLIDL